MQLLEIKEIKAGDITLYIKLSIRAMIEYENLSGGSINEMKTTENTIQFIYSTSKAGAKAKGIEFPYTYDSFIDMLDELDYTRIIHDFLDILYNKAEQKKTTTQK